jgi:hypothetical protein
MEGDSMENAEHWAIVKKGVRAWNEWRNRNPKIKPDLSDANLPGAELSGANLANADLSGANLTGAYLSRAHLSDANLNGADLSSANLSSANLSGADLSSTNLSHACLAKAFLFRTQLVGADLSGADLTAADLTRAELSGETTSFPRQLVSCNLTGATLTGAKLYGTSRDDWIITGVKCAYVFWDAEGKVRSPQDRDLAPGEFEQLYRTLPTIEYVFQNGMTPLDPLIMDRVVQAICEQNPKFDIQIDSISARGLAPSIKFTVQQEEQKEPALQMIVEGYETRVQRLEAEKDHLYNLLGLAIDKAGTRLLVAGPGAVVATDGSTINIDHYVEYITNLRDTIAALPEDSPTFAKKAKKAALDIIGDALKDVAKGQVKEAAKQIYGLGKDLGPVIVNTVAYGFFRSCLGL